MKTIDQIVEIWQEYANTIQDWEKLVEDTSPKATICGPVYEPPTPLPSQTETFAIADMRDIDVAHPHYHANGETEIYIVLQGSGLTVVGGEERVIKKGSVVVTPPNTAHFTIPKNDLVLMVINSPSFNPANNIEIEHTDPDVKFDADQYMSLLPKM